MSKKKTKTQKLAEKLDKYYIDKPIWIIINTYQLRDPRSQCPTKPILTQVTFKEIGFYYKKDIKLFGKYKNRKVSLFIRDAIYNIATDRETLVPRYKRILKDAIRYYRFMLYSHEEELSKL